MMEIIKLNATQRPQSPALREKEYGIWQTHTWADLAQLVEKPEDTKSGRRR